MKKFTLIPVFFIVLALISSKYYDSCEGVTNSYKAIACNACHGGSVAGGGVVVIGGGKDEVNDNGNENDVNTNDIDFELNVDLPNIDRDLVQIATYVLDRKEKQPTSTVNLASTALSTQNITVFNSINLSSLSSGKNSEDKSIKLNYHFDEAITKPQTIVVQGVISNNDGTPNGDQTFYEEVVIQPKNQNIESANLSIVQENYFYNNNQLIISSLSTKQVRVMDLQGRVLINTFVDSYETIDLSSLIKGNYFAVIGNDPKSMESFQFAK